MKHKKEEHHKEEKHEKKAGAGKAMHLKMHESKAKEVLKKHHKKAK
jgi:hypothetical protein